MDQLNPYDLYGSIDPYDLNGSINSFKHTDQLRTRVHSMTSLSNQPPQQSLSTSITFTFIQTAPHSMGKINTKGATNPQSEPHEMKTAQATY